MSIYVKDADGNRKKVAGVGLPGPAGKSAYQYAVEGGFTGTEDEFRALMGVRSNPNLLDNGHFLDPINQMGQTEYTKAGYGIDRWKLSGDGQISVTDAGVVISAGASGYADFSQNVENYSDFFAKSFLISAMIDDDVYSLQFVFGTFTGGIPLGDNVLFYSTPNDHIKFRVSANSNVCFKAAKLEFGPVQTLAHQDADGNWVLNDPPPNRALELLKCQRYQVPLMTTGPCRFSSVAYAYNWIYFVIPVPVNLRVSPTIINPGGLLVCSAGDVVQTGFTFVFEGMGPGWVGILAVKDNHRLTAAELLILNDPDPGIPMFDANL